MHKFGFDGPKLDGCGAQTDMQLWDGMFKVEREEDERTLLRDPHCHRGGSEAPKLDEQICDPQCFAPLRVLKNLRLGWEL